MVGLERTVVPLIGADEFSIGAEVVLSFAAGSSNCHAKRTG